MHDRYKDIPFDELRMQQLEIAAAIAQRRSERLEALRQEIATLGFTAEDLYPRPARKGNGKGKKLYRDPDNPQNTWGGRGRPAKWLQEYIDAGRNKDEFLVS